MSVCLCIADSVVPSTVGGVNITPTRDVSGEGGTLPGMYAVEAGINPTADNATYCRGVQPITIEPMDCESDHCDVEPPDVVSTSTPAAVRQDTADVVARPSADVVTPPAMRVVYCGTVSRDQLLQQSALGELAQNIIGPAPASGVRTSRQNLPDVTMESPFSAERVPPDVGEVSVATDGGRVEVTVQRRGANVSTRGRGKKLALSGSRAAAASTSDTGSTTGRKAASKSRRAQSLDGVTMPARRGSVMLLYRMAP